MAPEQQPDIPDWKARMVFGRRPKRTLLRVLILVILSWVFFTFLFLPIRVVGVSMSPTYRDGSVNFVNRLSYVFSEPRRGDVVGIKITGEKVMYLKRIVALPGETIAIDNGKIKIDNQPLDEPYVKFNNRVFPWRERPKKLGSDEYFVVGDNRGMTQFDHTHGYTIRTAIIGKVLF